MNKPPSTVIKCKTPDDVCSDFPADYSSMRVFSYPAYAHVNEGKLEPKSKKIIFWVMHLG